MKLQCSCGAKYQFEVTAEMARQPVKFVCPACGADSSAFVNSLVREQLGLPPQAGAAVPMGVPLTDDAPAAAAAGPRPGPPMRLQAPAAAVAMAGPAGEEEEAPKGTPCLKHAGQFAVEKCRICAKPICPKCMELFGYVCSPLCKAKAESHGINVPVYAGQRAVMQRRMWRKVALVGFSGAALVIGIFGFWFWAAWFGCLPQTVFSVRFDQPSYSGQSIICGKENDQIVFLHGPELARYDMQQKKKLWSRDLIDRKKIAEDIQEEIKRTQEQNMKLRDEGYDLIKLPPVERMQMRAERAAESALTLYARGESVWVGAPGKLTRLDWESGKTVKELPVQEGFGGVICKGDEMMMLDMELAKPVLMKINMNTCDTQTEDFNAKVALEYAAAAKGKMPMLNPSQLAGLSFSASGDEATRPMDPGKVAEQAQHMSMPARVALPALLANTMNQQRLMAEMNQQDGRKPAANEDWDDLSASSSTALIPTKEGFVQVNTKLLEKRIIERVAMKEAPKKSVLEGNVTAAQSLEVANEILNEMQRNRGGDKVREDLSRYRVTIRGPEAEGSWSGEVEGPPTVYPLETVKVLAANKIIVVFDKANKKLWQSSLTYSVKGGWRALEEGNAPYGQGPCAERKGSLFVFDEGVLTAFDLATGNARWRLPSVGIAGLFFDEKDMIYVNTTTATRENLKYSRQIDVSQKVSSMLMKVDSRNGKVLWSANPGGLVNQVYGDYIFTVQYYMPPEDEIEGGPVATTGFETPAYLRIRRINPRNGKEMWEHFEQRAPLDIQFEKNIIRCVFKKEVQVMKIPTWW